MKQIKLMNLKLTNFKGIEDFEFNPEGSSANIYAENGSGKTTIVDGYSWLLTGNDSKGNSTNNIKIKTKVDGKVVHKLEHIVEGTFSIDGTKVVLKKVYKEIWRKKTGEITENHTGHTTDHFIDESPVKEKDYKEFIGTIIDTEKIPLLIDLWHFNETYKNDDRRKELFDVIGGMTDEEIMNSNDELKELPSIIESRSVEKHMEKVLFEQKSINDRIEEIPLLIRENEQNKPDINGSEEKVNKDIKGIETKIAAKQEEINDATNGGKESDLKKQLNDLNIELKQVVAEHEQKQKEDLYKLQTRLSEEETNLVLLRNNVKTQIEHKKLNEQFIQSKQQQMNDLREEFEQSKERYEEESKKEFDDSECVCPTCERELQQEKVDEAVARFNKNKSDSLEEIKEKQANINKKGVELKEEVEKLQTDIEPIDKEIEKITEQAKKKKTDIELLIEKVEKAQEQVVPVEQNEKHQELTKQITDLTNEIDSINENIEETLSSTRKELALLEDEKRVLQIELNKFDEVKRTDSRNQELEVEEKKKAQEFAELERQKHLINKFTKTKVSMVEGSINKHFKYVNFKLFDELQNGGLRDICIVTMDGKEFGTENNTANDYHASLDVINTLSKHYGVQMPLMIDRSESLTESLDTDTQLITLNASKGDKELRIEIDSDDESEVA